MEDKKYKYGSVLIGGKEIPKTKNGLPNGVYLSKEGREILKKHIDGLKGAKNKANVNELNDLLNSLKK